MRSGYAIELTFDERTEKRVLALWDAIAAAGISSFMPDVGAFPHISLAVYDAMECSQVRAPLSEFAAKTPPLDVRISTVGTFPGSEGVVYVAPVVTPELLDLHIGLDALVRGLGFEAWEYYRPGLWVPHCTVAMDLDPDKVCECVHLCRASDVFGEARIVGLSLVSFRPVKELCAFPLLGKRPQEPAAAP